MKELHATASASVPADEAAAVALLRDLEGYPRWYPDGIRDVSVLQRDDGGAPTRVRANLRLAQGPLQRDFGLTLVVSAPAPGAIQLVRQSHGRGDEEQFSVTWRVSAAPGGGSRIDLKLDASLSVPRFLPVGGVGEALAQGFVGAAARELRR